MRYLGVIDYINALPLTYAIERGKVDFGWKMKKGVPSKLNTLISRGDIDAGFVSSIEYARRGYKLLPYSVGSDGEVMSVLLCSLSTPLRKIRSVRLTDESATSSVLLKALMKFAYRMKVEYTGHYADSYLTIGDGALRAYESGVPHLDLGEAWKRFSGARMVFGVLAARPGLGEGELDYITDKIGESREWCSRNMDEVVSFASSSTGIGSDLIRRYYSRLTYTMGPDDVDGLRKFLGYAKRLGEITEVPNIQVRERTGRA